MATVSDELLNTLKDFLRVKNSGADDEIQALVEACLLHLEIAGVYATDLSDPLVVQAVKLYCKANFGYDSNTERFEQAYSSLRDSMALCGDYSESESE